MVTPNVLRKIAVGQPLALVAIVAVREFSDSFRLRFFERGIGLLVLSLIICFYLKKRGANEVAIFFKTTIEPVRPENKIIDMDVLAIALILAALFVAAFMP
jgi:hypothetical protein